jgi:hypothetical protein
MSLALFALAEPAIAQVATQERSKKPPPKRTVTALKDLTVAPEPR